MKFYVITNGYVGEGYCRAYVAAESDDRAKEIASEIFRKENASGKYPEKYHAAESLTIAHCLDGSAEVAINEIDD